MTLEEFNDQTSEQLKETLFKCCGSSTWVNKMSERQPFKSEDELFNLAERFWHQCTDEDWIEAFSHHPKLGDLENIKKKFAATAEWAGEEQLGAKHASPEILEELAFNNEAYEKTFGFIFVLFATGKTAKVMLSILRIRLNNDRETELMMAMVEQNKITKLRLEKLITKEVIA